MTDEECRRAFSDLRDALRDVGLDWVVDQVNDLLALGRVTAVQVSTIAVPPGPQSEQLEITAVEQSIRRGGRKADFAKAVEYSPREQLTVLLDAIDQVYVQTAQMQLETENAAKDILGASGIELAGPTTATETSPMQSDIRFTSTSTLAGLLRDLRSELARG